MKYFLFTIAIAALVGACAPYPYSPSVPAATNPAVSGTQALTHEQHRQLQESRDRLEQERRERVTAAQKKTTEQVSKPVKPTYPTAASVPGKPGFVFNPYTHNVVDVKGIGSGKLVRDPEDSDSTHKFRVP